MSVSSEKGSCCSDLCPPSATSSVIMKPKRRWIEMSYVDMEMAANESSPPAKQSKISVTARRSEELLDHASSKLILEPRVSLPQDPRNWTKRDVRKWLKYMTATYDIELSFDKFDMNGKALCMMNMEMFVKRVPVGGKFLFRDFRLRLYPAVFFQKKTPDYSRMTPLELLTITAGKYIS